MQLSILSPLTALISLTALTLAAPLTQDLATSPALLPRSQYCFNAPKTKAGTFLPARALPPLPLHPRVLPAPITWCTPNSATSLHISFEYDLPDDTAEALLQSAHAAVVAHADGPLPGGQYQLVERGLELSVQNANNHQLTWGTAGAAVQGVWDYMMEYVLPESGMFAAVTFAVFDGGMQVGTGAVQIA